MSRALWELQQLQKMTLNEKISMTLLRIEEWYKHWKSKGEGVYYSWSGGKDSTVLKHLIKTNFPYYEIPGVNVDTGLEYPELREFVRQDKDVIILRPEKPFWQVVRDYGYPVISKEVSECIENARKHLTGGGVCSTLPKTLWNWRVCHKGCKRYLVC